MIEVKPVQLKGGSVLGVKVAQVDGKPLAVIIVAPKGVLVCANFDIGALESKGVAAVMVQGINSVETALETEVVKATSQAKELGAAEGMAVREALEKLC